MENSKIKNSVDQFLNPKSVKGVSQDGVERINKKYITEDGRQLLQD